MEFLHVKDTVSKLLTLNEQYKLSDNADEQYHIIYDMCRIIEQSPQNVKNFIGDKLYRELINIKNEIINKRFNSDNNKVISIYVKNVSPLFVNLIRDVNQI